MVPETGASRIDERFAGLRAAGRKALVPFITAGDPEPGWTVPLMHRLVEAGADLLELGVPFSDPMADGPVIQRSSERALAKGMTIHRVLEAVSAFRQRDRETPVVLMGYLNPIEVVGYEPFARQAREVGVDGVLTVDLPPEEAGELVDALTSQGMAPVFLLAPTTTEARIAEICRMARGFVYYVSLKGVTGSDRLDPVAVAEKLALVRRHTALPIGVGFGIKDPESAAQVAAVSDAVVIGSALVARLEALSRRARAGRARGLVVRCRSARRHRRGAFRCGLAAGRSGMATSDWGMDWFKKLLPSRIRTDGTGKRVVPEGLWTNCPACKAVLYQAELERNANVCPKCDHHMRIGARRRIDLFLDPEPRTEIGDSVEPVDFLRFKDTKRYKDRLSQAQKATEESDALVVMAGRIQGQPVVICAFEFEFMGGSMGSVVGERFVRGVNAGIEQRAPVVCFSASGGARMQEALVSLMQMAKTSAALGALSARGLPYISVLTDPTMGGVSASLAMLGDINIAEPGALIGFAGPRVIEQTVRQTLPEGFQRSEFLLQHGAIDMIVDRRVLRDKIAALLGLLGRRPAA